MISWRYRFYVSAVIATSGPKNENHCLILANFVENPILFLYWSTSLKRPKNKDAIDILSEWKSCQFFSDELNTFFHHKSNGKPHIGLLVVCYPSLSERDTETMWCSVICWWDIHHHIHHWPRRPRLKLMPAINRLSRQNFAVSSRAVLKALLRRRRCSVPDTHIISASSSQLSVRTVGVSWSHRVTSSDLISSKFSELLSNPVCYGCHHSD